jgi:hypothetical protein
VRFHAEASAALHALLEARLGEPTLGHTHGELRARLRERGMDEGLTQALLGALERSERVRFGSGGAGGELASASDELRALCEKLRAFSPSGEAP